MRNWCVIQDQLFRLDGAVCSMECGSYTIKNIAVLYRDAAEYTHHIYRHVFDRVDPTLSNTRTYFGDYCRTSYNEWTRFLDAGQFFEEKGSSNDTKFIQTDKILELWHQINRRGYNCSIVRCPSQMNTVTMITSLMFRIILTYSSSNYSFLILHHYTHL